MSCARTLRVATSDGAIGDQKSSSSCSSACRASSAEARGQTPAVAALPWSSR
jgi:hypothetical protein